MLQEIEAFLIGHVGDDFMHCIGQCACRRGDIVSVGHPHDGSGAAFVIRAGRVEVGDLGGNLYRVGHDRF